MLSQRSKDRLEFGWWVLTRLGPATAWILAESANAAPQYGRTGHAPGQNRRGHAATPATRRPRHDGGIERVRRVSHPSPCHRRQKLLEEDGIITRYVALLDQERVGLPVNVFVSVELSDQTEEHLAGFEAAVSACPEVMECYVMTGTADFLLRVVAADLAAYEHFLRTRLTRIPSVRTVRSAFALKRVIYRTNLPLGERKP